MSEVAHDFSLPTPHGGPDLCVVGMGSLAGDDRAGWRVIELLSQRQATGQLPADRVQFARVGPPEELLNLLPVRRRLLIVDACRGVLAPGQWARYAWPALHLVHTTGGHNLPLVDVLELAEALGLLPPRCEIWCVGGSDFRMDAPLTPPVEEAAGRLADLLAAELKAELSSEL